MYKGVITDTRTLKHFILHSKAQEDPNTHI